MLDEFGVDVRALGAMPIHSVGLNAGRRRIEHRLPFQAMSLSRRVLDEALIQAAHAAGARVLRGQAVRRVDGRAGDWRVHIGGEVLPAGALFIASGKHDLRGRARPPGRQPGFVGMKLHLDTPSSGVELVLFDGGYAGIEPIEGGRTNLCLLIHRDRLASVGGDWPGVVGHLRRESSLLRGLLRGNATQARPLTIANIP
jgi:menaquinone-9 beta-reductase